jgi:hypothetical protein
MQTFKEIAKLLQFKTHDAVSQYFAGATTNEYNFVSELILYAICNIEIGLKIMLNVK